MAARLQHLNGNILVAVDTETTGLIAGFHDLIQIAVIPLDSEIRPLKELDGKPIYPFITDLKPKRPENADATALRVNKMDMNALMIKGMEPDRAADKFDEWFQSFNFAYQKKFAPLGHNYSFDKGFLIDWLGDINYAAFFDYHVRDTATAALFMNDRAAFKAEPCPLPKVKLSYLASQLEVPHDTLHNATEDALLCAECYRRMVKMM